MSIARKALGAEGEKLVAQKLESEGFVICAQNYKTRQGEIDVIAQKRDVLIFVEVKLRETTYFNLSEVVSYPKQQKIIRTAAHYISKHSVQGMSFRFDVALLENQRGSYTITYISNAFTAPEAGDTFFF